MRGGASRLRGGVLALVLLAAPLLAAPDCGKDVEPGRLGEPCTRSGDCAEGLRCLAGTCDRADGAAGPASDGAADGARPADASGPDA